MKFGTKASEAPKFEGTGGGGGVRWMRTLKEGEHKMRFLDETSDWQFYWEHYNPMPGGFPFPCTGDKATCPGCTSGIEKMEKASPKYAVNAKIGDFVDVYKFPTKFYNKMDIRSERNGGTILDRDYLVTRIGKDTNTDYDIDMLMPSDLDKSLLGKRHNIEEALAAAFKEAWPDFNPDTGQGSTTSSGFHEGESGTEPDFAKEEKKQDVVADSPPVDQPKEEPAAPKAEEKEVTEAELRAMSPEEIKLLCKAEKIGLPEDLFDKGTTDAIVDWMLQNL